MNVSGALQLLINLVFDVYLYLLLTRLLLQVVRADFFNPVTQFVVRATDPFNSFLRRALPPSKSWDFATIITIFVVLAVKLAVLVSLSYGHLNHAPGAWLILFTRALASMVLDYLFWLLLVGVILSWVAPDPRQPVTRLVFQLSEPLLGPVRRLLPNLGGLDFSPMVVLFGIYFLRTLFGL